MITINLSNAKELVEAGVVVLLIDDEMGGVAACTLREGESPADVIGGETIMVFNWGGDDAKGLAFLDSYMSLLG